MEKDRGAAAAGTAGPSPGGAASGPPSPDTADRSAPANSARPPTSRKRKRTATTKTQLSRTVKTSAAEWSVASICGGRYKVKTVFSADERYPSSALVPAAADPAPTDVFLSQSIALSRSSTSRRVRSFAQSAAVRSPPALSILPSIPQTNFVFWSPTIAPASRSTIGPTAS